MKGKSYPKWCTKYTLMLQMQRFLLADRCTDRVAVWESKAVRRNRDDDLALADRIHDFPFSLHSITANDQPFSVSNMQLKEGARSWSGTKQMFSP